MNKIRNIYIHVPFCQSKCDYCAFYSIPAPSPEQIHSYLDRLEAEVTEKKDYFGSIETIFIGGGTPTLLKESELSSFLNTLSSKLSFAANPECTIECNPESLTPQKIELLASSFVNRISMGIQSFNPTHRKTIGRCGSLDELNKKIVLLAQSGIENISFDLIYGIPGQTLDDWLVDLTKAIQYPIHHLSAYALSIEDMTQLAKGNVKNILDEDLEAEMWQKAGTFLENDAGIFRYEISNYAQPGFECKHNMSFWNGNTYLGLGPAAVSFTGEDRVTNSSDFMMWLSGKEQITESVSNEIRARELLSLSLRTKQGIDEYRFQDVTGLALGEFFSNEIEELMRERLLIYDGERVVPTEKGLLFADDVAARLI